MQEEIAPSQSAHDSGPVAIEVQPSGSPAEGSAMLSQPLRPSSSAKPNSERAFPGSGSI